MIAPPFLNLHGRTAPYSEKPAVTQAYYTYRADEQGRQKFLDGDYAQEFFTPQ
jgi:hypothetical protein